MFRFLNLPSELQQAVLENCCEHKTFTITDTLIGKPEAGQGPINLEKIKRNVIWPQSLWSLLLISHGFHSIFLQAVMNACQGIYQPLSRTSRFLEYDDLLRASLALPYSPLFSAVSVLKADDLHYALAVRARLDKVKTIKITGRNRHEERTRFKPMRSQPLLRLVDKIPDGSLTQGARAFMQHVASSAADPTEFWDALQGVTVHWETKIRMSNWEDDIEAFDAFGLGGDDFLVVHWSYRDHDFEILDTSLERGDGARDARVDWLFANVVHSLRQRVKAAAVVSESTTQRLL